MSSHNINDVPPQAEQQPTAAESLARVDSPSQQASTSAGDGSRVPADQIKNQFEVNKDDPNTNVAEGPSRSPSFKEQVYGYARLIRGTVLGQPNVKEQGTQVLRGEQGIPLRRGSQSSK